MARALELVLGREPVGGASEVRAHRDQCVHDLLGSHQPDAEFVFPALIDLPHGVVGEEAGLELLHRLEEDIGEHEPAEDAGQSAQSGGQGQPGGGDHEGKAATGHFALLADVCCCAAGEGRLGDYLIWRDFFRHQEFVKKRNKQRSGR